MTSNSAFKNQVRELMAETGVPYAEARTQLLSAKGAKSSSKKKTTSISNLESFAQALGLAIITTVKKQVHRDARELAAEAAWVRDQEDQGYTVVEGGQVGVPDAAGKSDWEIHDWRTGALLASGHGSFSEMYWNQDWRDITNFWNDYDIEDETLESLHPELQLFISDLQLSDEFREWVMEEVGPVELTQAENLLGQSRLSHSQS